MNDVQPERAWFEKANQDLEMAHRALRTKILRIQIQTGAAIYQPMWEIQGRTIVLIINPQIGVSRRTAFDYLLSRVETDL